MWTKDLKEAITFAEWKEVKWNGRTIGSGAHVEMSEINRRNLAQLHDARDAVLAFLARKGKLTMTLENLKTVTYNQAEYYFHQGIISEDLWAEYRHLWQSSAPRFALKACWCESCQATSAAFEPVSR